MIGALWIAIIDETDGTASRPTSQGLPGVGVLGSTDSGETLHRARDPQARYTALIHEGAGLPRVKGVNR